MLIAVSRRTLLGTGWFTKDAVSRNTEESYCPIVFALFQKEKWLILFLSVTVLVFSHWKLCHCTRSENPPNYGTRNRTITPADDLPRQREPSFSGDRGANANNTTEGKMQNESVCRCVCVEKNLQSDLHRFTVPSTKHAMLESVRHLTDPWSRSVSTHFNATIRPKILLHFMMVSREKFFFWNIEMQYAPARPLPNDTCTLKLQCNQNEKRQISEKKTNRSNFD